MILTGLTHSVRKAFTGKPEASPRAESSIGDSFQGSVGRVAGAFVLGFACLTATAQAAPSAAEISQAKFQIADACGTWISNGRYQVVDQVSDGRYANREDYQLNKEKLREFHRAYFKVCKATAEELGKVVAAVPSPKADPAAKENFKKQASQVADAIFQRRLKEEAQIPQAELEAFISGMPGPAKSCGGAFVGGAIVGSMLSGK